MVRPPKKEIRIFRDPRLNRRIEEMEREALKDPEKGWVHATMLAWQRHYLSLRKKSNRFPTWHKAGQGR